MINIDRTWVAVEPGPHPVIHFEGKNIRGRTDLEHEIVCACAVNCSVRNQEEVMFFCRMRLYIFCDVYLCSRLLAVFKRLLKFLRNNIFLEAEVHVSAFPAVEDII